MELCGDTFLDNTNFGSASTSSLYVTGVFHNIAPSCFAKSADFWVIFENVLWSESQKMDFIMLFLLSNLVVLKSVGPYFHLVLAGDQLCFWTKCAQDHFVKPCNTFIFNTYFVIPCFFNTNFLTPWLFNPLVPTKRKIDGIKIKQL